MHKCVHHGECVKFREQLIEVSVLSPLYEFHMLNSDLQTCQNAPYHKPFLKLSTLWGTEIWQPVNYSSNASEVRFSRQVSKL